MALRNLGFPSGSPPPLFAAIEISFESLLKILTALGVNSAFEAFYLRPLAVSRHKLRANNFCESRLARKPLIRETGAPRREIYRGGGLTNVNSTVTESVCQCPGYRMPGVDIHIDADRLARHHREWLRCCASASWASALVRQECNLQGEFEADNFRLCLRSLARSLSCHPGSKLSEDNPRNFQPLFCRRVFLRQLNFLERNDLQMSFEETRRMPPEARQMPADQRETARNQVFQTHYGSKKMGGTDFTYPAQIQPDFTAMSVARRCGHASRHRVFSHSARS